VAMSFSIARSRFSALSAEALRAEVLSYTRSDAETSSILRSLERFGEDTSIVRYEVTPTSSRRTHHTGSLSAWTVRAVR
jgi:hypothetical protein